MTTHKRCRHTLNIAMTKPVRLLFRRLWLGYRLGRGCGRNLVRPLVAAFLLLTILLPLPSRAFEAFDLVSGIIESQQFKGKDPGEKLKLAADVFRNKRLKQSDTSFVVLDWSDQFVREPVDQLDRLKRWTDLINDDKLSHLRIPRDFLNRTLVAEYLVDKTAYLKSSPHKRLEILAQLAKKNLVDWSVSLTYARLYAGGMIAGAKTYQNTLPSEALAVLKKLKDDDLVGWHYRIPTEGILLAEALALDKDFRTASPYDQLVKLRDLEKKGIISTLTRKEFEKLPAWRLLVDDPSFLKAEAAVRAERLAKLKSDGIISSSTWTELKGIFRPVALAAPQEARPTPVPQRITPPGKQ
jgi:hypothetical protein